MSQHWKSLLVVLVIIGAIVFFYRGDKEKVQTEIASMTQESSEAAHTAAEEPVQNHSKTEETATAESAEAPAHTSTAA